MRIAVMSVGRLCPAHPLPTAERREAWRHDPVARVRLDDGGGRARRAVAAVAPRDRAAGRQRYRGLSRSARRDRARSFGGVDRRGGSRGGAHRGLAPSHRRRRRGRRGTRAKRGCLAMAPPPHRACRDRPAAGRRGRALSPARLAGIHANAPIEELVARVEAHLERNPNDARGYAVLVPVYLRLGRFAEAVEAERKVIALAGETAERQADLGEALTAAANGIVTSAAKSAFDRALTLDPAQPKARFFLGLAAEQDGQREQAAAIWRALLDQASADAPWAETVRRALARLDAPESAAAAPGPSAADIAAAAGLGERERGEMIRGMVARLAARLRQNGDDVAGWQRLLRAYVVLGERGQAQAAAAEARRALAADADKLRRIDDVIRSLGLGTP